jgi:ribonuclease E
MVKRMLIDARHSEETRVVVVSGTRLEELDVETSTKKQIKGNIYLAKVIRVEPSLQAAFVEYGGNRHGFLAFSEIHPDYFQIPVADRQALLAEQRAEDLRNGGEGGRNDDDSDDEERSNDAPAAALTAEPEDAVRDDGDAATEAPPSASSNETEADVKPSEPEAAGEAANDAPAEAALGIIETVSSEPVSIEMLGGDDSSEVERPRPRSLRNYKIQEVIKRRQIMLVQVVKEERGNKGAALTTFLSLAGRYCVLMPNTARGGGVSRKITSSTDRRRLKSITNELEIPDGMAVIVRTAGQERTKPEIKRDFEYLIRVWDNVRDLTLRSTAPALVYEEGSLIKRAIRDLYARDIEEVHVEGEEAYRMAKDYMRMLTPSHAKKVQPYRETVPLFHRYQVEAQLDAMHNPVVQLRSGGYIVINQTEALVAIDVNSGRATRERHIEETAYKTNMEAADEIARQLRLRDLAGLIVIDFIDMEDSRNNASVERRIKEAMKSDRARIQLGRISHFGLLELSRQRLRPSLQETAFQPCAHCGGTGMVRSVESTAMYILRAIEEEGVRRRSSEVTVTVASAVALYILNQKREQLTEIESRYGFRVFLLGDDSLIPPNYRMDRVKAEGRLEELAPPVRQIPAFESDAADAEADRQAEHEHAATIENETETESEIEPEEQASLAAPAASAEGTEEEPRRRKRRRKRRRRPDERTDSGTEPNPEGVEGSVQASDEDDDEEGEESGEDAGEAAPTANDASTAPAEDGSETEKPRRRRGKRGGRRRTRRPDEEGMPEVEGDGTAETTADATTIDAGIETTEAPAEVDTASADTSIAAPAAPALETAAEPEPVPVKTARRSRRVAPVEGEETPKPKRVRKPRASAAKENGDKPDVASSAIVSSEDSLAQPDVAAADTAAPIAPAEPEPAATVGATLPVTAPPAPQEPEAHSAPAQPARRGWWNRIYPD